MVALRCPMCCKRKFKTQMSLKYHILSYMYNIFCTLCSRRVGNMQELIDHLEAGCEKANSASVRDVPVTKNVMVQTQEKVLNTKVEQGKNVFNAEEVDVDEVGPVSVGSNDDGSDYQGDKTQNLLDGWVQSVPVVAGCNTPTNIPNESTVTEEASSHKLFACNYCCTTFSCVEEHVKLHHSEQDVEVHKLDSSIMHFWKSRWKEEHLGVGQSVKAHISSTVQYSELARDSGEEFHEVEVEQPAADSGVRAECFDKTDLLGRVSNCDSSSNSVDNRTSDQSLRTSVNTSSNFSCETSRNVAYRNNRDTEHAYSSRRDKNRPPYILPRLSSMSEKRNSEDIACSKGAKGKMLCVCNPSNHQHSQCREKQQSSTAIEFSEAIPKLFSQKNGKGVPTVVVFNGDKLTSILTPMTSNINLKALQKCNSLYELVSAIGSRPQRTYPRALVKSTGECVYRDRSGMFYTRKLIPSSEFPSSEVPSSEVPSSEVPSSEVPSSEVQVSDVPSFDSVHDPSAERELNCSTVDKSNICVTSKETSQESYVDDGGKHRLETACNRKKIRNEKDFIINKIVDVNGKFLDNVYTCCKCHREFRKYLAFCKHDCEIETDTCSCLDCENQFPKKRILTIHFKDIEPEVDSQKAMIQIGLGLSTEIELPAKDSSIENVQTNETDDTKGSQADVKITVGKRRKKIKAPKKVLPPEPMICHICSIEFTKKVAFVGHLRMHAPKVVRVEHNEDGTPVDYICEICSFVAEHKRGLNQHMRVHFPEEYAKRCAERKLKNAKEADHLEMPTTFEQRQAVIGENDNEVESVSLSCNICGAKFSQQIDLDDHLFSHSYNEAERAKEDSSLVEAVVERAETVTPHIFTCEICSKRLDVVFRHAHIASHFGDERFTCEICNENLYTREKFNLHMRAHKGDNPYICRVCRKKFGSLQELDKHVLSHNGTNRYACRFCDRWFQRPISKVEHERVHTGEKPFSCNYCGMKFRLKGTRELHVRIHTGLKPYSCEVCKKRFRSKYNLQAHVAIHSDERKYKCSICPKTFKTAVSLSSHKNIHTKPYKCPICQRRFETSYSERQHRKSHLSAKSTLKYKCDICGVMYARPFGLRDHMLTHSLKLEAGEVKTKQVSELMETVDDECTQTADLVLTGVNEECTEAAEFLVVSSNEDPFPAPELVVNIANEDKDYAESMYAVTEEFTNADSYLIAGVENRHPVEFLVVETSEDVSDSQYILAVAEEESAQVPQLELSDMYDECELSKVTRLENEDLRSHFIGFSNNMTFVSTNGEENVCVPPVPVNFEEV